MPLVPDFTERALRDVQLIFRNFSGRPSTYHKNGGVREFGVVLDREQYEQMLEEGWNVKERPGREEGDPPRWHLPVAVGYKIARKPKVVMIGSKGKTQLDEGLVDLIDGVDIRKADVIVRARHWDDNGTTKVKAWLQTLYVTIIEDELDLEYSDVPYADGSMPYSNEPTEEPPF